MTATKTTAKPMWEADIVSRGFVDCTHSVPFHSWRRSCEYQVPASKTAGNPSGPTCVSMTARNLEASIWICVPVLEDEASPGSASAYRELTVVGLLTTWTTRSGG